MLIFPVELYIDRTECNLSSAILHCMLAAHDSVYSVYTEHEMTMETMKIHKRAVDRLMVPDSVLDANMGVDPSYLYPAEDPAEFVDLWPLVVMADPVKTKTRDYMLTADEFSGFAKHPLLEAIASKESKEEKEEK
jgi:hypothetical protein